MAESLNVNVGYQPFAESNQGSDHDAAGSL